MESNKFEQDIKNKLEKRTIQPTANSWDKLTRLLQQKEHKKNYKFLWLIGAAASVVGILFINSIFLKEDIEKNTPTIVTVPEVFKEDSTIKVASEAIVNKEEHIEKKEVNIYKTNASKITSKKSIYNSINKKKEVVKSPTEFALNAVVNNEEISGVKKIENVPDFTLENQKIDSLISQIKDLKVENKGIEISEIDALLFKAQRELTLQKIVDESIKTVDAYKLLQDVEADLDKSFRIKVLETLKLNYENMKTVIAQRNN
tara:strand:+ start:2522 stop:3298 length:777 start_codon:yes stop_codon:yes gene_type:complete